MTRCLAEDKAVVIAFSLKGSGCSSICHNPVMVGVLRMISAIIILRNMSENAQRFFLGVFDEFHTRMVLPLSKGILFFIRCIIILLVHKRSRVGD